MECMDIQANPGPSQTSNITDLRSSAPVSEGNLNYILPTSADRKVYNRTDLLALRSCKYGQETQKLFMRLKTNGIFRYRGPRRYQGWSSVKRKPIPTLSERKFRHARGNYSDYHAGDSQNKTVNFGVLAAYQSLKIPNPMINLLYYQPTTMIVYLHLVEFHLPLVWLDIINLVQGAVVLILIIS